MITLLGWCLFPVGLAGTMLVGRKIRKGWLLSLLAQALWLLYAAATRQYNLMPGTLAYTAVYIDNYVAWGKEGRATGLEALAVRLWRKMFPGSGTDHADHADLGRSDGGEDS
jgi:hypothetical protein